MCQPNAPAQLRASQIKAHAKHAQSLDRRLLQRSLARERRPRVQRIVARATSLNAAVLLAHTGRCRGRRDATASEAEQSRPEIPNDSIVISGPRRAWAGAPPPSKARPGRRTRDGRPTAGVSAAQRPGAPQSQNAPCSRANAPAQLRASQIKAHAQHAQSINRPSAAAFVSARAETKGARTLGRTASLNLRVVGAQARVQRAGAPPPRAVAEQSRLEIPNDLIVISGLRRAWAPCCNYPRQDRAGGQALHANR